MKIKNILLPVCFLSFLLLYTSCEAFFTTSWFQGAADHSGLSVDEALSSGDPEIMAELYNSIVEEALNATGVEASDLYIQAAELALGISGMNDISTIMGAMDNLSGGEGGAEDLLSVFTDTDLDLTALENVSEMIANADASDPGSVPPDMWLFSAAGSAAALSNDAEAAGLTIGEFLSDDPIADNSDVNQAVQSLVYAMDVLPQDIQNQLLDNQADLISKGIIFP